MNTQREQHVCTNRAELGHQPFFKVEEYLPKAIASTGHVQVDGSQEGKVDSDNILRNDYRKQDITLDWVTMIYTNTILHHIN